MTSSKTKPTSKKLKYGRPPLLSTSSTSASGQSSTSKGSGSVNARRKSSKATRTLINSHHQLQKSRAAAHAAGNSKLVADLDEQIASLGGLPAYQAASLTGQDRDRGGDSSEKLVEWLYELGLLSKERRPGGLRVLEIGSLSSKNAISQRIGRGVDSVRRIDLHSTEPGVIQEIDFMQLAAPQGHSDKFDLVSLSLVLNYVPDAAGRGDMLKRTKLFLKPAASALLFIVLPLPCLSNSRYMDRDLFCGMLRALGFELAKSYNSQKLVYMLFRHIEEVNPGRETPIEFKKTEINPGKKRNNFSIVM